MLFLWCSEQLLTYLPVLTSNVDWATVNGGNGKRKAESGNGKLKQEMVVKCTVMQRVY